MRMISHLAVVLVALLPDAAPSPSVHRFAREDILGTSFDLHVVAPTAASASKAERTVLSTLDRFSKILSTYDEESEISRLDRRLSEGAVRLPVSNELARLLRSAGEWSSKTDGIFHVRPVHPDAAPGFALLPPRPSSTAPLLECTTKGKFDLDAIAKGHIIDRCIEAVRKSHPEITGLLLDIGGDIRAWGERSWRLGVADPLRNADNAPVLARLNLRDRAVAGSGLRARADGTSECHIIDPRTGAPVTSTLGTAVIAPTAETADVLATTIAVLTPKKAIDLIKSLPDTDCLIVDAAGGIHRSPGWHRFEVIAQETKKPLPKAREWPQEHAVTVRFTLANSTGTESSGRKKKKKFKRHFTAVWVEDAEDKLVKVLAVWAKRGEIKYVKDLDAFWDAWSAQRSLKDVSAVARPSRSPGAYTLEWDGTDLDGNPVPQGTYSIHLDINREDGPPNRKARHTHAQLKLRCETEKDDGKAEDQPELQKVSATYGPRP